MRLTRRKGFQEWNEYKSMIDELDTLLWQQIVRQDSLNNSPAISGGAVSE